jgi:hypothetical protein
MPNAVPGNWKHAAAASSSVPIDTLPQRHCHLVYTLHQAREKSRYRLVDEAEEMVLRSFIR